MDLKIVLTCVCGTLLIVSGLVQQSNGGSSPKLVETIRNNFTPEDYVLGKLSKSKRDEMSWFKRKRTMYRDPCVSVKNVVDTKVLIEGGSSTSTFTYEPSKLTEVKCQIKGNSLNARGKPDCKIFTGDCIDIISDVKVLKFMGTSYVPASVKLKVGCACKIPI